MPYGTILMKPAPHELRYEFSVGMMFLVVVMSLFLFPGAGSCFTDRYLNHGKHVTVYGVSDLMVREKQRISDGFGLVITQWWKHGEAAGIKAANANCRIVFYRDLIGARIDDDDDWHEMNRHPEWFLREPQVGRRIRHKVYDWYLMDIRNPDYREHLLAYVEEKLRRYGVFDGIFFDDVSAVLSPHKYYAEGDALKNDQACVAGLEESFREGVRQFFHELRLRNPERLVYINTYAMPGAYAYVDGIMFEGFVHGSWQEPGYNLTTDQWEHDIRKLTGLAATGKEILVHSGSIGLPPETDSALLYSLCSYLLCASPRTSFYFQTSTRRELPDLSAMETGRPLMPMQIRENFDSRAYYFRRFELADIYVNPFDDPVEIQLPGSAGNRVMLPARSGYIDQVYKSGNTRLFKKTIPGLKG